MEKEYNVKLIVEFIGKAIGENRQEAINKLDMTDFIDHALHDERYKIKQVTPRLSLRTVLLPIKHHKGRSLYADETSE